MTGKINLLQLYRARPYRNIFAAILAMILLDAMVPNDYARGRFSDLMVAGLFLVAMVETVWSRHNAVWALICGVPAIAIRIVAAFRPDTTAQNTTVLAFTVLFFAFLIWNLLHDLNHGDRSTSERVFGALCAYVFVGLLFALVFAHIEYRHPGSFTISNQKLADQAAGESSQLHIFTYFSFVTITTLGYGDVTPITEKTRTLAWLEALFGQLYLAVMVAAFVAMHVSGARKRDGPRDAGNGPPES